MGRTARHNAIEVRRLSGAIGAEISGVDLTDGASDDLIAELRTLWLEHLVLFFRGQTLPPKEFLDFASRFGEPMEYPFLKGLEDFPLVTPVIKRAHETVNFGGIWHTDTSYLETPPMATMLIARTLPPFGGDTLFANGYLAYETLSDGMKRMLGSLTAVNSSLKAGGKDTRILHSGAAKEDAKEEYISEHPVVRTHPETGKKSLYVHPAHTVRFKNMTEEESAPLLDYLFRHQVRPEFTCRFSWSEGAIALWDNRCALHNPINDYHGHERVMHRVTLKGDKPV
jgi:taurine dioxygenase